MADFFVSPTGSDVASGTTWANAKATVQAALTAATSAGDRVIVAPGWYYCLNLYPATAGTRANHNALIGDYDSSITDGGGNKSGVSAGYIIFDASVQTGFFGPSAATSIGPMTSNAQWAYWDMSNFVCTGGQYGFFYAPHVGNIVNDGTTLTGIIGIGYRYSGFVCGEWVINPDTYSPITINKCIAIGLYNDTTVGSACGFNLQNANFGSAYTNENYVMNRCIGIGRPEALHIFSFNSNYKIKVKANNCSFIAPINAPTCTGVNATYGALNATDCYFEGNVVSSNLTISNTRPKTYLNPTGQSTEKVAPLIPTIPFLHKHSGLIDVASTVSVLATDIFGNTKQGANWDNGAQEYLAGQYPKEPTQIFQVPGSGSGGKRFSGYGG